MKKLTSLLLAAVMCLSLAACGGSKPDKQPAIDAYNAAADAVREMLDLLDQNADAYADYFSIEDAQELVDTLNEAADALENEDLDQATLDQLVASCQVLEQAANEVIEAIEG